MKKITSMVELFKHFTDLGHTEDAIKAELETLCNMDQELIEEDFLEEEFTPERFDEYFKKNLEEGGIVYFWYVQSKGDAELTASDIEEIEKDSEPEVSVSSDELKVDVFSWIICDDGSSAIVILHHDAPNSWLADFE